MYREKNRKTWTTRKQNSHSWAKQKEGTEDENVIVENGTSWNQNFGYFHLATDAKLINVQRTQQTFVGDLFLLWK